MTVSISIQYALVSSSTTCSRSCRRESSRMLTALVVVDIDSSSFRGAERRSAPFSLAPLTGLDELVGRYRHLPRWRSGAAWNPSRRLWLGLARERRADPGGPRAEDGHHGRDQGDHRQRYEHDREDPARENPRDREQDSQDDEK